MPNGLLHKTTQPLSHFPPLFINSLLFLLLPIYLLYKCIQLYTYLMMRPNIYEMKIITPPV